MRNGMLWILLACSFLLTGCASDEKSELPKEVRDTGAMEGGVFAEAFSAEAEETANPKAYDGEVFTWNEITLVIPIEWEGKYIIKEEANGVSFYQKASCEIESSLGYLCGIYKSDAYSNTGTGDTMLAYTQAGMCYYLMQPTDLACYTEEESIIEEYNALLRQVPWIAGSVQIAAENVFYDVGQYVIPVSSIKKLEHYHVANLTDNELWIARNEIYARHGKVFMNEYLQSYFYTCSWYQPKEGKTDVTERELSEIEIANLSLIIEAESAYETAHPYPKEYRTGTVIRLPLKGDETEQEVSYEVLEGTDGEAVCMLTIDGTGYELNDYVTLFMPEEEVFYVTDISETNVGAEVEDGLEIAVLAYSSENNMATYFFKYDGGLRYIGEVAGFPFEEQEYLNGFNGQNGIMGLGMTDLIENAYVDRYYRYDRENQTIEAVDLRLCNYKWYEPHELYKNLPVYYTMDETSPTRMLEAQKEVYFLKTDTKEWILVRGKDGTEGYIQVKDENILNIGLPADEVFSELYFFR